MSHEDYPRRGAPVDRAEILLKELILRRARTSVHLRVHHHEMHRALLEAVPRAIVRVRLGIGHREPRLGAHAALATAVTALEVGAAAREVALVIPQARHVRHPGCNWFDLGHEPIPLALVSSGVGNVPDVHQELRAALRALFDSPSEAGHHFPVLRRVGEGCVVRGVDRIGLHPVILGAVDVRLPHIGQGDQDERGVPGRGRRGPKLLDFREPVALGPDRVVDRLACGEPRNDPGVEEPGVHPAVRRRRGPAEVLPRVGGGGDARDRPVEPLRVRAEADRRVRVVVDRVPGHAHLSGVARPGEVGVAGEVEVGEDEHLAPRLWNRVGRPVREEPEDEVFPHGVHEEVDRARGGVDRLPFDGGGGQPRRVPDVPALLRAYLADIAPLWKDTDPQVQLFHRLAVGILVADVVPRARRQRLRVDPAEAGGDPGPSACRAARECDGRAGIERDGVEEREEKEEEREGRRGLAGRGD
mmetsp:Transcript_9060/g.22244  ORF Transcript_9060/g.22244 Transcript_9060/m.22244 type:complete len:472 (+) Transcript_9060:670-2085(+)